MFSITPSSSITDDNDRGARGSPKLCHVSYEGTIRVVPDSMMDMAYNLAGEMIIGHRYFKKYTLHSTRTRLKRQLHNANNIIDNYPRCNGYSPSSRMSSITCLFWPQVDKLSVSNGLEPNSLDSTVLRSRFTRIVWPLYLQSYNILSYLLQRIKLLSIGWMNSY